MTGRTDMEQESGFEQRARVVLAASVTRIDARTRSRLNRGRQAALEAAAAPRRSLGVPWRSVRMRLGVMPFAGAAAAAVLGVGLALFMRGAFQAAAPGATAQPPVEVLDMLADDDSIAFMENYDHSFYEWAAAQEDAATGGPNGAGGAGSAQGDASGGSQVGASGTDGASG